MNVHDRLPFSDGWTACSNPDSSARNVSRSPPSERRRILPWSDSRMMTGICWTSQGETSSFYRSKSTKTTFTLLRFLSANLSNTSCAAWHGPHHSAVKKRAVKAGGLGGVRPWVVSTAPTVESTRAKIAVALANIPVPRLTAYHSIWKRVWCEGGGNRSEIGPRRCSRITSARCC